MGPKVCGPMMVLNEESTGVVRSSIGVMGCSATSFKVSPACRRGLSKSRNLEDEGFNHF